ncbi:MAG: hypothetical protein ACRDGO_02125 [Actinomycetota bacterium]
MTVDGDAFAATRARIEPSIPPPVTRRRLPGPVVLIGGLLGGVVWGGHARVWMRFISSDPEFTWSGTVFIVIGFGVAGLGQAAGYLGRRAGLRRSRMTVLRLLTFASLVPLGAAAGAPVFPTVVLAPLAIAHTEWSSWMRVLVGVIALLPVLAIGAILFDDLSTLRAAAGFLWFLVVYAGIVWAAGFSLAPHLDGWRAPRAARVVGVAALTMVAALEVLFLVGPKG